LSPTSPWNACSRVDRRGDGDRSAPAGRRSGAADGQTTPPLAWFRASCKHKSSSLGAVDDTAASGARQPQAGRPQDACSLCSEPALSKRGGLPLAHDTDRRRPRSRGYRVGTRRATPTDAATAARLPGRCSTPAPPTDRPTPPLARLTPAASKRAAVSGPSTRLPVLVQSDSGENVPAGGCFGLTAATAAGHRCVVASGAIRQRRERSGWWLLRARCSSLERQCCFVGMP
jgi:hypothetical protein